jgi:hypothetical protein
LAGLGYRKKARENAFCVTGPKSALATIDPAAPNPENRRVLM